MALARVDRACYIREMEGKQGGTGILPILKYRLLGESRLISPRTGSSPQQDKFAPADTEGKIAKKDARN